MAALQTFLLVVCITILPLSHGASDKFSQKTVCLASNKCFTFRFHKCDETLSFVHTTSDLLGVVPRKTSIPLSQLRGRDDTRCHSIDMDRLQALVRNINESPQAQKSGVSIP